MFLSLGAFFFVYVWLKLSIQTSVHVSILDQQKNHNDPTDHLM